MGKITVHEFATVDASVGAPLWTMDFPWTPEQTEDIAAALTAGASAILLGRTTYEMFARPGRSGPSRRSQAPRSSTTPASTWSPARSRNRRGDRRP